MNIKEIISCQKKFDELKQHIDQYIIAYMDTMYKKILELDKDFNCIESIKKNEDGSMIYPFYNYDVKISKPNYYGIPEEVYKISQAYSIKDIVDSKYDTFCGCIEISSSDRDNAEESFMCLAKMYVNYEGVYKIEQIISGGKNTFRDECKAILIECMSRIYTNTYSECPQ